MKLGLKLVNGEQYLQSSHKPAEWPHRISPWHVVCHWAWLPPPLSPSADGLSPPSHVAASAEYSLKDKHLQWIEFVVMFSLDPLCGISILLNMHSYTTPNLIPSLNSFSGLTMRLRIGLDLASKLGLGYRRVWVETVFAPVPLMFLLPNLQGNQLIFPHKQTSQSLPSSDCSLRTWASRNWILLSSCVCMVLYCRVMSGEGGA